MSEVTRTDISENGTPAQQPMSESSIPVISDYQGKPTILLNPGGRYPFSMGMAKARMVLNNVRYIQHFVDTNGAAVE
ncbi:hypothetical protein EKK58_00280 [Candidatus Dependentiae bacterium]|nr:MAG: hypothetical protein EKK58_00280 [Candidatus Dependentiae bacterium]